MNVKDNIMDACDIETFLICDGVEDGKKLGLRLMAELGFEDADVVFCEEGGSGVRIRLRAYVHRPASVYRWHSRGGEPA